MLRARINQSIEYVSNVNPNDCGIGWNSSPIIGYFGENTDQSDPMNPSINNIQNMMATLLAQMYLIELNHPVDNLANDYLYKVTNIANRLKNNVLQTYIDSNGKEYYAWPYDYNENNWEDIGHAWTTMQFAEFCYRNNIPDIFAPSNKLFWSTDMSKFANQIVYKINLAPRIFSFANDGSNYNLNNYMSGYTNFNTGKIMSQFGFMCPYNSDIYQILSDYFVDEALGYIHDNNNNESYYSCLGLSYLTKFQNILNPIGLKRNNSQIIPRFVRI